jgi:hypothetical protein
MENNSENWAKVRAMRTLAKNRSHVAIEVRPRGGGPDGSSLWYCSKMAVYIRYLPAFKVEYRQFLEELEKEVQL